jgi:uncharacterized coiled-coil DUF342 family protein
MKKQILFLFVSALAFSCSNKENLNQQANNLEETPEVLDNNKSDLDFSSYNKRMYSNIIDQLFQEAIGKNEDLKSIVSRIDEIRDVKKDSLEQYQKYVENNQNYWNSLNQYANQLSDTVMRDELKVMIDILEKKFAKRISPLTSISQQIDSSEQILKDQVILMKILVTEPMMSTYQRNEYPDINTLNSVNSSFDSLNNDVKPYTVIRK